MKTVTIERGWSKDQYADEIYRTLLTKGEVRLYCRDDIWKLNDVMHVVSCRARRHKVDVVWKILKHRNANEITLIEFTGMLYKKGIIRRNPFAQEV